MYNESQIQDETGANENDQRNNGTEVRNNNEQVKCQFCNFYSHNLTSHIKFGHKFSLKEYKEKYGHFTSDEYRKKMSLVCRESLKDNHPERQRRSKLLSELNKRQDFRDKSSKTAKITSAKPDIQKKRTLQLKNWRDNNPNDFFEKCTKKMLSYKSLGEKLLSYKLENFQPNQFLKSKEYFKFNKTSRKQVDFLDRTNKIAIEFDGEIHFKQNGITNLQKIQEKDNIFDSFIQEKKKYSLIRISFDCIQYKTPYRNSIIRQEVLEKLAEILDKAEPGKIYHLGKSYGNNNLL